MAISKILMEFLPNIHLLGVLTAVYTLVFRKKALIPIYIYVIINGIISGFNAWWVPYLYIWTVLWGMIMILPKNMPKKVAVPVYSGVCALHGLLFGTLYSPFQAIMFGLSFKQTAAWIIAGLPFDLIQGLGNLCLGLLIVPLQKALNSAVLRFNKH